MSQRVEIRVQAEWDLAETAAYLGQESVELQGRFLDAARSTFEQLAENPGMGHVREFRNPRLTGMRSWRIRGFERYLVFYFQMEAGIDVVRVLHGARDIDSIFSS